MEELSVFNPARYSNKISERYYSLDQGKSKGRGHGDIGDEIITDEEIIEELYDEMDLSHPEFLVRSMWNGDKIYENVTRSFFSAITGIHRGTLQRGLKKDVNVYESWIYSREIDISSIDVTKFVKYWGVYDNTYYFGSVKLMVKNALGIDATDSMVSDVYYRFRIGDEYVSIEGLNIYINRDYN